MASKTLIITDASVDPTLKSSRRSLKSKPKDGSNDRKESCISYHYYDIQSRAACYDNNIDCARYVRFVSLRGYE